jgi:hypothetical protein
VAETGSCATEALRSACAEVEWIRLAEVLVKDVVEGVADAQVEGEIGAEFPLILRIRVDLCLAQAVDR